MAEGDKDDRSNTVFIGKKPTMDYVMAVAIQFSRADEVVIKARGRAISAAVDVAEIVRSRINKDVKVKNIVISTEKLEGEGGRVSNVSSIEIFLVK
ncbi:MAG: DNA-binding protein Alba [Euryarchaeota archaeon]|nr:DNA-binding protein Alba [Euryarchaeota archaeon]